MSYLVHVAMLVSGEMYPVELFRVCASCSGHHGYPPKKEWKGEKVLDFVMCVVAITPGINKISLLGNGSSVGFVI